MKLLIDIGNTSTKWTCYDDGHWSPIGVCSTKVFPTQIIKQWMLFSKPEAIAVCHVAEDAIKQSLDKACQELWQITPFYAKSLEQQGPVVNKCLPPTSLGVDRWMAAIAAFRRCETACCILDSGTALTFDVVDKQGQFLGGYILPGFKVIAEGFKQCTQKIHISNEQSELSALHGIPNNTVSAIKQAHFASVVGGCEQLYRHICQVLQVEPRCFMAGGEAALWQEQFSFECEVVPTLVFEGLLLASGF